MTVILFCMTILLSCASHPVNRNKTQALYGMIYDRENKPVYNAAIYVNKKYMASSDVQGHFAIPQIKPKLRYTILAQKKNYEDIQLDVAYDDPTYVLYIRMASGDQLLDEAEQAIRA
jgi:hypothetical protein